MIDIYLLANLKRKYGNKEIELPKEVLTIYDSYANFFSSGTNGYLTKARIRNNQLEFYHDWWAYGWFSYDELHEKYPEAVDTAVDLLLNT